MMSSELRLQFERKLRTARITIDDADSRDDLKNALDLVLDLVEFSVGIGERTPAEAYGIDRMTRLQDPRARGEL